jgi:hypothetical protein
VFGVKAATIIAMRPEPPVRVDQEYSPAKLKLVPEWVVWTTIGSAVVAGASLTLLLWFVGGLSHKDALDVGLKITLATVGTLGVILGVRRYNLSEREHDRQLSVDRHVRADAIARQITDLSSKASEQLGSDKAAVRLGGITDLERLAGSYPDLRQTVIDRLCAYLRGPYTPPVGILDSERSQSGDVAESVDPEVDAERRLELDVRRMAQKVLLRHLRWPVHEEDRPADYWEALDIDLSGAVLVEFDLSQCRIQEFTASGTVFHGPATFDGARFETGARMAWARFKGLVTFTGTHFNSTAMFHGAQFFLAAGFEDTFIDRAIFDRALFAQKLEFFPARCNGVCFRRAKFIGGVHFSPDVDGQEIQLGRAEIPAEFVDRLPPGWTADPIPDSLGKSVVVRAGGDAGARGPSR